ncbi:VWA domain-containing protein [Rhodobacteraceae bacterium M382]|nr:VWA domain-containing protein [Rhodobacteraceae bacterium M382]
MLPDPAPTLWSFPARQPGSEVLEWRTDVLASREGEQRIALRPTPRETLTCRHLLGADGMARAAELARSGFADEWLVPLWAMATSPGITVLETDTTIPMVTRDADYRGPGFAALASDGGETYLVEVAQVFSDRLELVAPVGVNLTHAIVAPVRRAVLTAPVEIERRRQGQGIVTASFHLLDSADLSGISGAAIYIAIDNSYSMSGAAMTGAIAAVQALIADLGLTVPPAVRNDICILTWHGAVGDMILRRDADTADFADIANWLTAQGALGGGTDFGVAVSEAEAFFAGAGAKRRVILFLTDGEPYPAASVNPAITTLGSISDVEVFGFNIGLTDTSFTALLDNTPEDGVPVIAPGDIDTLLSSLRRAFTGLPIYLGRDVLIDPTVLRQPLRDTIAQTIETIDNGFGPIVIEPTRAYLQRRSTLTFLDYGRQIAWSRRRWLHSLCGRQRSFWLPTWGRELVLQADVLADDDFLIVAPTFDLATWINRHVMIDMPTGGIFRQVTAASFEALGHRLTMVPPGVDIPADTPVHVLTKMRLDTDRIELEHSATRTAMSATVIEVLV